MPQPRCTTDADECRELQDCPAPTPNFAPRCVFDADAGRRACVEVELCPG